MIAIRSKAYLNIWILSGIFIILILIFLLINVESVAQQALKIKLDITFFELRKKGLIP